VRARELGFAALADDIFDHADRDATDPGSVARDRLKVDTRKWYLSKMLPKVYGDRIATEVRGRDGGPIEKEISRLELARWIAFVLTSAAPEREPARGIEVKSDTDDQR
jgi:hypothetical protein